MTHIYASKLTIIVSDNGLSPGRRQAEQISMRFEPKFMHLPSKKFIWKFRAENGGHFVSASMCRTYPSAEKFETPLI